MNYATPNESSTTHLDSGDYSTHGIHNIKLCSGYGMHHTDLNKPLNNVTWDDITALVDEPQDLEKPQAQWLIPSTL